MIQGAAETATVMPPGSHGVAKHQGMAVEKRCDDPIHAVSHWGWFSWQFMAVYGIGFTTFFNEGFQQTLASKISKQGGNSV